MTLHTRHAGIMVPLFSIPSNRSWGIGEIADIPLVAEWLRRSGQDILQVLPINEMAPGQYSPYSAISAMAIDPIFISMREVPDFAELGGEEAIDEQSRDELAVARNTKRIDYAGVRALKDRHLARAFQRFREEEWEADTARARELRSYIDEQSWWLDEYALFRALHAKAGERPWTSWRPALQAAAGEEVVRAREELAGSVLYFEYLQWIAEMQWQLARQQSAPVLLFGDLPFMVDKNSADVWANQDQFRLDGSVGAPPDAFSATGQNWGLPVYRWDVMRRNGFEWLQRRARRNGNLYDGYRIDHLVGFYRTYVFEEDGTAIFFPEDEADQLELGEEVMRVFLGTGARIIAEDLGTVPDFVRESLKRLEVPGYRVLRWERHWKVPGQPFREPRKYPPASVATTGTHDTDPMAVWWETADEDERRGVGEIMRTGKLIPLDNDVGKMPFGDDVRDLLLQLLFDSGSNYLILPVQDIFGWKDRINLPATLSSDNWTYRLPWPSEQLTEQPLATERSERLRGWSRRSRRAPGTFD
jgi:4-alpha-glucanotransferase